MNLSIKNQNLVKSKWHAFSDHVGVQTIAYEFIVAQRSFVYRSNKVISASKEWETIVIPLSELEQPDWGNKMAFDVSDMNALSWQVSGMNNDSGSVATAYYEMLSKRMGYSSISGNAHSLRIFISRYEKR